MFAFVCFLLFAQSAELAEHKIANIFHPLTTPARSEFNYAMLALAISCAIFLVVATLIVWTMFRFRSRAGSEMQQEPPQIYGSNRIEAAWTVIPILIVFVLAGVTARVVWAVADASPPKSALHVVVTGHQYWWEVRYPHYGIVTANEIHVPVARNHQNATFLELTSSDVIHSLWVPELGGKTDLIPKRANHMWMDPSEPGVYWGSCTEFCGVQHANMLIQVVAQEPEDFRRWVESEQKSYAALTPVSTGEKNFQMFACGSCHTIKGTNFSGRLGPDLTHVMSRRLIGSGVLANTPEGRRAWVANPQESKPGCLMPGMKLTGKNLDDLTAFVETLN